MKEELTATLSPGILLVPFEFGDPLPPCLLIALQVSGEKRRKRIDDLVAHA
jgi:hypothetical protein